MRTFASTPDVVKEPSQETTRTTPNLLAKDEGGTLLDVEAQLALENNLSVPDTFTYANLDYNIEGLLVDIPSGNNDVIIGNSGSDTILGGPPLQVANPPAQTASGSPLKKLLRSIAAEGFSSGETKRFGLGLCIKQDLNLRVASFDLVALGFQVNRSRTRFNKGFATGSAESQLVDPMQGAELLVKQRQNQEASTLCTNAIESI